MSEGLWPIEISLDPDIHEYKVNGIVWPSVTEVLEAGGYIDAAKWGNDYALDRGKDIHLMCHLYDTGILDEATLRDDLKPRLEAYKKFLADSNFQVLYSEKLMASRQFKFCGTPDKVGTAGGVPAIVDIKSGEVAPWTALQTAGYAVLESDEFAPSMATIRARARTVRRYGLHLREDGSPAVRVFNDADDVDVWLYVALASYNWKKKHGIGGVK